MSFTVSRDCQNAVREFPGDVSSFGYKGAVNDLYSTANLTGSSFRVKPVVSRTCASSEPHELQALRLGRRLYS